MSGPIEHFMTEDHARLEALLQAAVAPPDAIDLAPYAEFRAGLLKHIGMEEKILLPAAQRLRGGDPLPLAGKLRREHGAIAALLVPTPTAATIAVLRKILAAHNQIEEGRGGLYDSCDRLAAHEASAIEEQLRAAPEVPVASYNEGPRVLAAICRALSRAGFEVEARQLREDE